MEIVRPKLRRKFQRFINKNGNRHVRGISAGPNYVHVRLHDDRGKNKRDFAMNVLLSDEGSLGEKRNPLQRSESRKAFATLQKSWSKSEAEEVRSEEQGRRGGAERQTSASSSEEGRDGRKRPGSSGWGAWGFPQLSPPGPPRASSACGFGAFEKSMEPPAYFRLPFHPQRKCKSNSNLPKETYRNCERVVDVESDFHKVRRSLRLLGFELSDLGICSVREETAPKRKPKRKSATFSTKVVGRSVSLDSLREAVRRARSDDRLDGSHRRLLSRAAYEEWYFTKERQLWEKREEERMQRLKAKVNLRDDFHRKKEKSEEEFRKWLRGKRKKGSASPQKQESPIARLDAKEKTEKAFLDWKKTKDRELERKKIEKKKEEEKKLESEQKKTERKIIAEKAFQQWKTKLEENERSKDRKRETQKKKEEIEERMKRAKGNQISFQMWKEAKDEQIKRKIKEYREAEKRTREERLAQMEERMYEAEQAFEDWLERIDLRKQKQFFPMNTYQKLVPWIPA